ncbi:MAG: efflux transporter outer membrane subunit [Robiginitomaculum sp.]|nr:efflux transporter outer membrane subunit [Robiginitomaculum sp.]MDQ7077230.1 efflux transporter outer membrane subunit [Robiginitomaculum sp.]
MYKKWLITASLLSLSACASVTNTADLTQSIGQQAPAVWQSQHNGDQALATDWLADFHDTQLTALVSEALRHNHDLMASAARIAQAQALAVSGAAARLPSVDFAARGTRNFIQNIPDTETYGATLSVSWEADLWGRIADRARAGYVNVQAAEADFEAARLSIAGQTTQAWFDLIEGGQQVALAKDDLKSRQRSARLVERRYGRGVSSSLDVRLARSALAGSEANLALREQQLANATRRLELLLGRYPAKAIKAAQALPLLDPVTGVGTPADVLVRRPDIIAAEARLTAAGLRASEARKALLPRLSFSPTASTGGPSVSDIFDLNTLAGRLLGNLAQPVFRGGALKAEIARTRAAQREQIEVYANQVLRAWREAEDALDGETYLARREAALRVSTTEARQAETLAVREYGRGVGTIFEMLDAQRRRIGAESQFIAASKERAANRVRLHLAIAGDFKTQAVKTAANANEDTSL